MYSRAAELAGAGNSLSFENLGGFAQFAGNSAASIVHSRPSTPSSADGYEPISSHDLDPELIVILKKISKRDTITKIKALEELESYLQNNVQAVAVILHNWVITYKNIPQVIVVTHIIGCNVWKVGLGSGSSSSIDC